jgi:hypothetical protein
MEKQFTTYEQSKALIDAGIPEPENPLVWWCETEDGYRHWGFGPGENAIPAFTVFDLIQEIGKRPNTVVMFHDDGCRVIYWPSNNYMNYKEWTSEQNHIDNLVNVLLGNETDV